MAAPRTRATFIELPTGQKVSTTCRAFTDWASVKMMVESGVPTVDVARLFKITDFAIRQVCKREKWLTPSRVESLKKELVKLQRDMFDRTGETMDVAALKALLWEERSERWKEKLAEIVQNSLDGVSKTKAKRMIMEAKDLKAVMDVARTLTGETQREDNAPKLAVSIGFLRSASAPKQVDMSVEAEVID
jgi:hypothetical protein